MSDDLGKAIKQITEMLSQDKGGDALTSLLSLLGSSGGKEDDIKNDIEDKKDKDREYKNDYQDNKEMIRQITNIMNRLNTINDPRINLLNALRPFLTSSRRKKLNNCIMLLQVTSLMRAVDE